LEPGGTIDEKHGVGDVVFLREFLEEDLGEGGGPGGKKLEVEEHVGFVIDGSVQPVALVIELDHSFVNRDVIRAPARPGLEIGPLHQVVNRGSNTIDTESIGYKYNI